MIKGFNDFNESVLYFAPPFREQLKTLAQKGSKIAEDLLKSELQDLLSDITFINSGHTGYLTFNTMNHAVKRLIDVYCDDSVNLQLYPDIEVNDKIYNNEIEGYTDTSIYSGNKNIIKIGKFVAKLLPSYTTAEIEKFVNDFKAIQNEYKEEIKIVSGEDIRYWYNINNYFSRVTGSLAKSCMANKDYFDIYVKNPESVKMVIMTSNNKLVARALLWKINSCEFSDNSPMRDTPAPKFTYFMDRIYVYKDYQKNIMVNYAEDQGWAYRIPDSETYEKGVIYKRVKYFDLVLSVKVKKIKYENYPFMDTFFRYDWVTGLLWNDNVNIHPYKRKRGYTLQKLSGDYIDNPRNLIQKFSDYIKDKMIKEKTH